MKVDAVIVIVPLQTRIDAMDFKEMPPEPHKVVSMYIALFRLFI